MANGSTALAQWGGGTRSAKANYGKAHLWSHPDAAAVGEDQDQALLGVAPPRVHVEVRRGRGSASSLSATTGRGAQVRRRGSARAAREGTVVEMRDAADGGPKQEVRLRRAALAGDVDTVQMLLKGSLIGSQPRPPVAVDATAADGCTALMYSSMSGHAAVAAVLLQGGAYVNATNALAESPLTLASGAGLGSAEMISLLLEHGAAVDHSNRECTQHIRSSREGGRSQERGCGAVRGRGGVLARPPRLCWLGS
jgi:hypothetical protein